MVIVMMPILAAVFVLVLVLATIGCQLQFSAPKNQEEFVSIMPLHLGHFHSNSRAARKMFRGVLGFPGETKAEALSPKFCQLNPKPLSPKLQTLWHCRFLNLKP